MQCCLIVGDSATFSDSLLREDIYGVSSAIKRARERCWNSDAYFLSPNLKSQSCAGLWDLQKIRRLKSTYFCDQWEKHLMYSSLQMSASMSTENEVGEVRPLTHDELGRNRKSNPPSSIRNKHYDSLNNDVKWNYNSIYLSLAAALIGSLMVITGCCYIVTHVPPGVCREHLFRILKSLLSMENVGAAPCEMRFAVAEKWYAEQPSETSHVTVQYFWFYPLFPSYLLADIKSTLKWTAGPQQKPRPDLNTVRQHVLPVCWQVSHSFRRDSLNWAHCLYSVCSPSLRANLHLIKNSVKISQVSLRQEFSRDYILSLRCFTVPLCQVNRPLLHNSS